MDIIDRQYQELANAVVVLAAKDYRVALKRLSKRPDSEGAQAEIRKLEDFFKSEWFGELTKVDPEQILKRLRSEVGA